MRISDIIEQFLLDLLNQENDIEIQRNDLASQFRCAPSQINYVIGTRFTGQRGYVVESRRGGGGSIRIRRISIDKSNYLMHVVGAIGDSISYQTVQAFLGNMLDQQIITQREAKLLLTALSDRYITPSERAGPPQGGGSPQLAKNQIRAELFKNMLVSII